MKKAFLCALAVLLIVALFHVPTQAQVGCKGMMEWSELVTPSPPYNACFSELKATFYFTIGYGGYNHMRCMVINSGWQQPFDAEDYGPGQGYVSSDWWHCTSKLNHQLVIDILTGDPPKENGFIAWRLKAEYFEDNPASPEP